MKCPRCKGTMLGLNGPPLCPICARNHNMKTKEIVSYLHKQGIFLTEDQARDIAFIVGEVLPEPAPATNTTTPVLDIVWEMLVEDAIVSHDSPVDRNLTFQELEMDSLDITQLVVACESRFRIHLDTEGAYPTNVAELVNRIGEQLK